MRPRLVYTMKAGGRFYVWEPNECTIINAEEVILYVNDLPNGDVELKCYSTQGQPCALTESDAIDVAVQLELPLGAVKLNAYPSFHEESEAGWWTCTHHVEDSTVVEERVPEPVQRPTTPNILLEETIVDDEEEEEQQRLLEEEAEQEALANTLTGLLLIKTLGGH